MKLKIALDWTPNAIHAGLFLAFLEGWYANAGLDVELISPQNHKEELSALEKLVKKQVSFAIVPGEMIIKSHQNGFTDIMALAAILQGSPSAFATLKSSGLDTVEKLSSATYAALNIPYEKAILNQLTKGNYKSVATPILDIYKLLFGKTIDLVWLFRNIEVVEAKLNGIELNVFSPEDAGIPYGHCAYLITRQEVVSTQNNLVTEFFKITARAYRQVAEKPIEIAAILCDKAPDLFPDKELLKATILASCEYYLDKDNTWGFMDENRWNVYLDWLHDKKEIDRSGIENSKLFSNRFL